MTTLIKNARIIKGDDIISDGYLLINDGYIATIGTGKPPVNSYDNIIDADNNFLSAGFIDIHTHGAGGADLMDGTLDA